VRLPRSLAFNKRLGIAKGLLIRKFLYYLTSEAKVQKHKFNVNLQEVD
jgi:hypothetical protein